MKKQNKNKMTWRARVHAPHRLYSKFDTNPLHATKKNKERKYKKKETSTPNVNKDTPLSITTNKGCSYWCKKKINEKRK